MRSLQAEAETGDLLAEAEVGAYWRKLRLGAYWWKLRHELAGHKTARMISGGGMHPDLEEVFGRDDFRRGNSS